MTIQGTADEMRTAVAAARLYSPPGRICLPADVVATLVEVYTRAATWAADPTDATCIGLIHAVAEGRFVVTPD